MPEAVKAKAQEAADASGRSLHAELLHRIQRSFEVDDGPAGLDLAPTVVRMERDLAKLEVDRDFDLSLMRMLVLALRTKLAGLSQEDVAEEEVEGIPLEQCLRLSEVRITKQASLAEAEAALERLKRAESDVRALAPEHADPMWEQMAVLKQFDPGSKAPAQKRTSSSSKPKP